MNQLDFNLSTCVRSTSKLSECTKCIEICPVQTINLSNNIPSFVPNDCVKCGGCVGVCPTESFSLKDKDHVKFFFETIEKGETIFSCKDNIPCISWFSVEHLISYALASKENITLDLSHCATCEIRDPLFDQIKKNIQESNHILESIKSSKMIEVTFDNKPEIVDIPKDEVLEERNNRRSFLRKFSLKGVVEENQKIQYEAGLDEIKEFSIEVDNIANIREKIIPYKRKLLWSVFKNEENKEDLSLIESTDISFISQKYIEDSCTNCQICYRICPTGALSSNGKFSVIKFDPLVCVKCNLCHEVCEPESIKLKFNFDPKALFGTEKETLIEFNTKRCDECGNNFTYKGGELICPRCKTEEDEAYTLHNISRGGLNF